MLETKMGSFAFVSISGGKVMSMSQKRKDTLGQSFSSNLQSQMAGGKHFPFHSKYSKLLAKQVRTVMKIFARGLPRSPSTLSDFYSASSP